MRVFYIGATPDYPNGSAASLLAEEFEAGGWITGVRDTSGSVMLPLASGPSRRSKQNAWSGAYLEVLGSSSLKQPLELPVLVDP